MAGFADLPSVALTVSARAGVRKSEGWLGLALKPVGPLTNGLDLQRMPSVTVGAGCGPASRKCTVTITGDFRLAPNERAVFWLDTVAALGRISRDRIRARAFAVGRSSWYIEGRTHAIGRDGDLAGRPDIYRMAGTVLLT